MRAKATTPYSLDRDVERILASGDKIAAIKRVREQKGLGLADAKTYVESIQRGGDGDAAVAVQKRSTGSGLVGVLVLGVALYFYLSSGSTSQSTQGPTSQAATQSAAAIQISAVDLLSEYEANEVAADLKYKGKMLRVSGTVDRIAKDITNTSYVTFSTFDRYAIRHVQAFFDSSSDSQLASLAIGSTVTIEGTCDGLFANVLLKRSRLR